VFVAFVQGPVGLGLSASAGPRQVQNPTGLALCIQINALVASRSGFLSTAFDGLPRRRLPLRLVTWRKRTRILMPSWLDRDL